MSGVGGKAEAQPRCLVGSLCHAQRREQLLGLVKEAVEKFIERCRSQRVMDLPVTAGIDARRCDNTLWTPLTHADELAA